MMIITRVLVGSVLTLLGYVWASPLTLLGLLLAPIYRARRWRWSEGRLEATAGRIVRGGRDTTRIWGRPGAQSHGWLVFYASDAHREKVWLREHEDVHVQQALVGGVLYAVAYAALFLWHFTLGERASKAGHPGRPRWWRAYRMIWFERVAYKRQSLFPGG